MISETCRNISECQLTHQDSPNNGSWKRRELLQWLLFCCSRLRCKCHWMCRKKWCGHSSHLRQKQTSSQSLQALISSTYLIRLRSNAVAPMAHSPLILGGLPPLNQWSPPGGCTIGVRRTCPCSLLSQRSGWPTAPCLRVGTVRLHPRRGPRPDSNTAQSGPTSHVNGDNQFERDPWPRTRVRPAPAQCALSTDTRKNRPTYSF